MENNKIVGCQTCITLSPEIIQHLLWRFPFQWAHREMIIIPAVIAFQLLAEVIKGIEGVCVA